MARIKVEAQPRKEPARTGSPDRVPHFLLIAIIILGTVLRFSNLNVEKRSPDEITYNGQAKIVLHGGIAGTREMVQKFLHHPAEWAYPAPNRIGYLALLAAAMNIGDSEGAEDRGSTLSCLVSIVTLAAAAALGLRFFGTWPAVLGVLFLAVFPPELTTARRCWSETLLTLCATGMFYFTMQICAGAKRYAPYILLPLIGSVGVLIKETSVMIYASCLVAAMVALARSRDFRSGAILVSAAGAGAIVATAVLAFAMGSLSIFFQILSGQARQNAVNQYAIDYCSGPAYFLPLSFFRLSRLTFTLAVTGFVIAIASSWIRSMARVLPLAPLAWITVINLTFIMIMPHWLNLRFAAAEYVPLCLFAGLAAYWLIGLARASVPPRFAPGVLAVAVGVIAFALVSDYRGFEKHFVAQRDNLDLSVKMVLDATE